MSYLQQEIELDQERWAVVRPWVAALLPVNASIPSREFPLDDAKLEGVLPWLAYRLYEAGLLVDLGKQQADLQKVLKQYAASHMFDEMQLERLASLAGDAGVDFLAFKGHAVARTLYSNPACRPTSDFDVLVAPGQVTAAQSWLESAGYRAYDPYYGNHWLASQTWIPVQQGGFSSSVDLHWDISNRMYFRQRVDIAQLIRNAQRVPCGEAEIRVPGLIDNCIIACIHLAAMDPGMPLDLRWLLDIRLLMAAIPEDRVGELLERADQWRGVEACLVFGEAAAKLDDSDAMEPVLEGLRGAGSAKRMREYDHTLRSRGYDLWCYWGRLPGKEKAAFFGDLFCKIKAW